MELITVPNLEPEAIKQALHYVDSTFEPLVRKVLVGEARFGSEIEALKTDEESSFYRKRDDLVRTLNGFPFNKQISDEERDRWKYHLFKGEFKEEKRIGEVFMSKLRIGMFTTLVSCLSICTLMGPQASDYIYAAGFGGLGLVAGFLEANSAIPYGRKTDDLKMIHGGAPFNVLGANGARADHFLDEISFLRGKGFEVK